MPPLSVIRHPSSLSRYWLLLGVTALAVAGLFSLVLVIARTPSFSDIPLFSRLFHEALVVHVDLSVLLWFLSIACLMWSMLAEPSPPLIPCLEESALISFALGMLAIALSPMDPHGEALMSNYIPVITSPVFFLGLSLTMCGMSLMLFRLFTAKAWSPVFPRTIGYTITLGGIIGVIVLITFALSFHGMPADMTPKTDSTQYYDLLFWGGGHMLQFLHAQILLVCWWLLALALKPDFNMQRPFKKAIACIGPGTALVMPLAYYLYPVHSEAHREFFTQGMIIVGGIGPVLMLFYLAPLLWHSRTRCNALWSTLFMSVFLFLYGGFLGELIQGQNVVIPAHYHGSIVGITLAFMGAAYYVLPMFGYKDVSRWKLAFWQPVIYGGGQMLHISGLAWSGGYGVLRKTPGGLDALSTGVKVAMGFMGLGGMIAIIGGFMFVIVVWKAVRTKAQVP